MTAPSPTGQAPISMSMFANSADYWKAMYERREQEAHELSEEIIRLRATSPAPSDGIPPSAMQWLTSTEPPSVASREWQDGWNACRNFVTAALAAAPSAPAGPTKETELRQALQMANETTAKWKARALAAEGAPVEPREPLYRSDIVYGGGLREHQEHPVSRSGNQRGDGTLALHGEEAQPVAWLYEDTLPDAYPYDEMFPHSEVRSGVRMFPVFPPTRTSPTPSARERAKLARPPSDDEPWVVADDMGMRQTFTNKDAARRWRNEYTDRLTNPTVTYEPASAPQSGAAEHVGALLKEAADQLQLHSEEYHHRTTPGLIARLRAAALASSVEPREVQMLTSEDFLFVKQQNLYNGALLENRFCEALVRLAAKKWGLKLATPGEGR